LPKWLSKRDVWRVLPYQYTGREADTEGLYYYRARYYSPMMGGFISEDPAGFAGGQNSFYAYTEADPLSFIDPFGLAQKLSYTSIMPAPGIDPNGGMWQVQWNLSEPSPQGGWVVQEVDVTAANGQQVSYWEAWQVAPNSTVTTQAAQEISGGFEPVDDTFDSPDNVKLHTSARFYEGLCLPKDFVSGVNPYAQALPATFNNPHLSTAGATPAVVRNWSSR
jgi:RHS repeat-associated protein